MLFTADIIGNEIVVTKPRDAGLLHSKNHFGTPRSGNSLQLSLLETVFLVGEKKLRVFENKREIAFSELVEKATETIPEFELLYLGFRDLRKRGYPVRQQKDDIHLQFCIPAQQKTEGQHPRYIKVISERDIVSIDEVFSIIQNVSRANGELWFMIVDEEGDLTYYHVTSIQLQGEITPKSFPNTTGVLLENRVVLFDERIAVKLRESEFFGKPFGDGLQLSLVESVYLQQRHILEVTQVNDGKPLSEKAFQHAVRKQQPDIDLRLLVFTDLKHRGLLVKTGFKFGTHFRAYTKNPDKTHAEYLIHVIPKGFTGIWAEISRAVRLAHSVNKEIVFARVDGKNIEYITFGRLRP